MINLNRAIDAHTNDIKINKSIKLLKSLQYSSGLFAASSLSVSTGYDKAWIRDNIYQAMGLEEKGFIFEAISAYRALIDVLKKHEYKIDWMIKEPYPKYRHRYIHARYHPITFEEFHEEWGNMQNDAVGLLLFKIGELEGKGVKILRDDDFHIIQKLVDYLGAIEYWHDKDNGIWEENEEVHASSVGACVAGLKAVKDIVDIDSKLIENGMRTLKELLPRESITKEVDLALLSLIYPLNVVDENMASIILKNIEQKLVRDKGVLRYINDGYYSNGKEAEWTMGFPWLAKIFQLRGNLDKYNYYMDKTHNCFNFNLELPELYFGGSKEHNENSPLGWAQAMFLIAS